MHVGVVLLVAWLCLHFPERNLSIWADAGHSPVFTVYFFVITQGMPAFAAPSGVEFARCYAGASCFFSRRS